MTLEQALDILNNFTDSYQSVVISSITKDGKPYASYAPFVTYENQYYLIISQIAKHYHNMKNHDQITLFWIENEKDASSIFFRKRLSYLVQAEIISPTDDLKRKFIDTLGKMVEQLFEMDFVIVKTNIIEGNFVLGPGSAYLVSKDKVLMPITPHGGHQKHK